jgi:hypothetical protein
VTASSAAFRRCVEREGRTMCGFTSPVYR